MSTKLISEALDWRYATKQYDKLKQITDGDMQALRNAVCKTPTSYGLMPWKVLEIKTPELRQRLREVSYNQPQVTDASAFFVFCAKKSYNEKEVDAFISEVASLRKIDVSVLAGYKGGIMGALGIHSGEKFLQWAQRQAYIGLGFLLETAAILHLDASPLEGFDPAKYNEILGLTDYSATVLCAVGYRHAEDGYQKMAKHRRKENEIFETR